jgi:hypothetical protein
MFEIDILLPRRKSNWDARWMVMGYHVVVSISWRDLRENVIPEYYDFPLY